MKFLQLDGLSLAAPDGTILVQPVTVAFPTGVTALLGGNGVGKSTLLRAIVGLHPLAEGKVRLGGHDNQRDRAAFLSHIVFVPQNFTSYPDLTAREFLTYFLRLRGVPQRHARDRVAYWLAAVGLGTASEQRTGGYSQGMLQRLAFAYAMQSDAALFVMDEPFAGIDPEGRDELTDMMCDVASGRTILLSTHHVDEVTRRGASVARIAERKLSVDVTSSS